MTAVEDGRVPTPGFAGPADVAQILAMLDGEMNEDLASGLALQRMMHHALFPSGKMLRPLMLVAAHVTAGGEAAQVLPAALGSEYGHVGSLVHDDIIDGDEIRRGKPSVMSAFGIPEALVAGDGLIFMLFAAIVRCGERGIEPDPIARAVGVMAAAGVELCRGQLLESEVSERSNFDQDTYFSVIQGKTASYFEAVCRAGAVLASAGDEETELLATFGRHFGLAFQIQDDLLPYRSLASLAGKPVDSDLTNGRITLPVVLAYQVATSRERRLIAQLHRPGGGEARLVEAVKRIVGRPENMARCATHEEYHMREAREAIEAFPASPGRAFLNAMIERIRTRVA
jgi:geranylgeranyl pyrophosphate synthase